MIVEQAPQDALSGIKVAPMDDKTPAKDVAQCIANWRLKVNEYFEVKLMHHRVGLGQP